MANNGRDNGSSPKQSRTTTLIPAQDTSSIPASAPERSLQEKMPTSNPQMVFSEVPPGDFKATRDSRRDYLAKLLVKENLALQQMLDEQVEMRKKLERTVPESMKPASTRMQEVPKSQPEELPEKQMKQLQKMEEAFRRAGKLFEEYTQITRGEKLEKGHESVPVRGVMRIPLNDEVGVQDLTMGKSLATESDECAKTDRVRNEDSDSTPGNCDENSHP